MCNTVFPGRGHGVSRDPWDQSPCCSPGPPPGEPEGGPSPSPATPSLPAPPPAQLLPRESWARMSAPCSMSSLTISSLPMQAAKDRGCSPGEAEARAGVRCRRGRAVSLSDRLCLRCLRGPSSAGPEVGMLEGALGWGLGCGLWPRGRTPPSFPRHGGFSAHPPLTVPPSLSSQLRSWLSPK